MLPRPGNGLRSTACCEMALTRSSTASETPPFKFACLGAISRSRGLLNPVDFRSQPYSGVGRKFGQWSSCQITGKREPRLSQIITSAPRTIESPIQSRSSSIGLLKENGSRPERHQPPAGPGATRLDGFPMGPRPRNGLASVTGRTNAASGNCAGDNLVPRDPLPGCSKIRRRPEAWLQAHPLRRSAPGPPLRSSVCLCPLPLSERRG